MKIIKNLKNMNEDKKDGFFSYWSSCCYTAFVTYLRKHYERVNKKRQFFLDVLQYAKDRGLFKVRPDIVSELQRQIDLYNDGEKNNG